MYQKRVAAIHDISGVGKCSLTVALPIISVAGIECCPIPTAVLSNHTGGFGGFTFKDLTDEILPIVDRWEKEGFEFDAIYSGYLGSDRQVDILSMAVDRLKSEKTKVIVDPVMGDNGSLYCAFSNEFPEKMRELCKKADVITPNVTEASLMLKTEYKAPPYDKNYIENLLLGLKEICDGTIVLTGVSFTENKLGAAAITSKDGNISYFFGDKVDGMYHGTGDVFASALVSALVSGLTVEKALSVAVEFTCASIKNTSDNYKDLWYGVNFEGVLTKLPRLLGGANG